MFKEMVVAISALLICAAVTASTGSSVWVSMLGPGLIAKIQKGEVENLVVEFKEGDRLPVNLKAVGDLFKSVDSNPTFVEVKKDFYVRIIGSSVHMSFDGVNFKPFNELLSGSVSLGAYSDNGNTDNFPASIISVVFSAFLK